MPNRARDHGKSGQLRGGGTGKKDVAAADTSCSQPDELPDDLAALKVTMEQLQRVRSEVDSIEKEPVPPIPVKMRKLKPAVERNRQRVLVAKVAPPDAPLRRAAAVQRAGEPQYDLGGKFIPYSVLGDEADFREEQARRRAGGGGVESGGERPMGRGKEGVVSSAKFDEKSIAATQRRTPEAECAAIRNWHHRMNERLTYHTYLQEKVGRAPEQLVMNSGEPVKRQNELKHAVDRTLAFVDYGKGHRVGSEFWAQSERIGGQEQDDDSAAIHLTLTATEKGYPPVWDHVGTAAEIQRDEKGLLQIEPGRRGWQDGEFLHRRMAQLRTIIHELDPHPPSNQDIDGLVVRGRNAAAAAAAAAASVDTTHVTDKSRLQSGNVVTLETPRTELLPEEYYEQHHLDESAGTAESGEKPGSGKMRYVAGPGLRVAGVPCVYQRAAAAAEGVSPAGGEGTKEEEVGASCRVVFEGDEGQQVTSWLELINFGSTVVRFHWNRQQRYNPFNKPVDIQQQRFYFNTGSSVILPRQKVLFPFVFKSDNPGIFTENWQLETEPRLCGGAKIVVALRGIALEVDRYKPIRDHIHETLEARKAESISQNILFNILDALNTPRRPASPLEAFITEEQKFEKLNPGLAGVNEKIAELRAFYRDLFPEEERASVVWDLDCNSIRERLLMIEEDKQREKLLKKFQEMAYRLTTPVQRPSTSHEMYSVCYSHLCHIIDGVVSTASFLRQALALPDPPADLVLPPDLYEKPQGAAIKHKEKEEARRRQRALEGTDKKDAKKGGGGGGGGKDKGGGKGGGKERPGSKGGTPAGKKDDRSKAPRMSTVSQPMGGGGGGLDTQPTDDKLSGGVDLSRPTTAAGGEGEEDSAALNLKYKQRMHAMVYELVSETLGGLVHAMEDVRQRNPWRPVLPLD